MNFQDIENALKITNRQIIITTNTLQDHDLQEKIIEPFYNNNTITITNASILPSPSNSIMIKGQTVLSLINLNQPKAIDVLATFELSDVDSEGEGTLRTTLQYTLLSNEEDDSNWQFSQSFADLPLIFDPDLGPNQQSALDHLTFTEAYFVLSTSAHHHTEFDVQLESGLNFVGKWVPGRLLGAWNHLFNAQTNDNAIVLHGPIVLPLDIEVPELSSGQYPWDVETAVPGISLQADLGIDLKIPNTTSSSISFTHTRFRIYSPLNHQWIEQNPGFEPVMAHIGLLQIPTAGVEVTLTAQKLLGVDDIFIMGDIGNDIQVNTTFSQLAEVAGGNDLIAGIPEQLRTMIDNIKLEKLAINLIPDQALPRVDFIQFGFRPLNVDWSLFNDVLNIEDLSMKISVANPFDSASRSVFGVIMGHMELLDLPFESTVGLPNLFLTAKQSSPQPFAVKELFQIHFPDMPVPPDLMVEDINISAELDNYYEISMGIARGQAWKIDDQLKVPNIHMSLSNSGWRFEGSTEEGGEGIPIIKLIEKVTNEAGNFDMPVLPDALHPLKLDSFLATYRVPDQQTIADGNGSLEQHSSEFSLHVQSTGSWELPVGFAGINISHTNLEMHKNLVADGQNGTIGNISGSLVIGNANYDVSYNFPGDFVLIGNMPAISLSLLLQEFCSGDVVRDLPLPVTILETELRNVTFTIAPQQKQLSFAAETPFGQAEILISQGTDGKWGFSIGFVPPDTWNFSAIDPALAVLNDLDFSGSTLIVSSSEDSSLALTTIELPNGDVRVQKGLNFFASLDTSALGMKELLPGFDLDSLQVYAAIGNNPQNMVIEAAIEGEFQIDKSTSFGDITFRLKPSPTDFELSLLGTVTTVIDESPLVFTGGLGVTSPPPAGRLQATMQGTWENPFGTQNLSISNVGLDLSMPPLSLGITGGLHVGDFEGKAAVSLNTANPTRSMLAVEFNELKLVDVFDAFCPPQVRQAIPRNLVTTVLEVDFEDVKIHIVPQATTIGEVAFEQGITLQGRMNFWGLTADGFLNIDQGTGILVRGNMDPIILGNILKLTGAQGKPKATLLTDLRLGQPTNIVISGGIEVLGMSRDVDMTITDAGFTFATTGKIFDLFEATLAVRGSDMANGDGIMVRAAMKNDLFDYLSDKASATIEAAAKEAMREIADAQRAINRAQTDVDQLNKSITAMRRTIEDERARDNKRLRDAQNAVQGEQNKVNSLNQQIANMRNTIQRERDRDAANLRKARQTVQGAQNKVNGLNSDITSMRRTVQTERDRDTANLRRAQTSVNNAQNEVNKIQRDINNTKSRITTINNQIAAKKRWLDARAWHEKIWAGPEYAAYESAKRIEQGALYTKLGGMEAAKHTALGILEAAKRSLRGMEQAAKSFPIDADPRVAALITARGTATAALNAAKATLGGLEKAAKTFPIDADPRMVGLFAARNTANGALAAAKLALKGIEAVIKIFPVDADPRMISLFTARDTATAGLEVAKFTLEGVKQSVKGMAEVSQFIANGAGQLLIINEAMFESSLSAAHGGDVSLAVKLTFMNEPHDLAFDFDFHDPQQSAHALADLLLPG